MSVDRVSGSPISERLDSSVVLDRPAALSPDDESADGPRTFLAAERAGPREFRLAIVAVAVSTALFVAAVPFARVPLGAVQAFTPVYVSALVICDLITAVLLFGQFNFLRSRGLLILACAYLFTASMTFSYVFMFPGLFSPGGLLGAGPQSTSAMYIFWHAGFPILVIAYALLKDGRPATGGVRFAPRTSPRGVIAASIAAVLAVVVGYTIFATAGHAYLPLFIDGNHTSDLGHVVLAGDGLLSFTALVVLWRRRPHTVLDLWLMVVMCVWIFDLGLAAILNSGRYDLGWYAGRIYGLLAASSLLVMLLIENGNHYARLVRMSEKLGEAKDALERLSLHDGLTNLANRRYFDSYLASQAALARRFSRPLSLVLFDIDCFKNYNDHYGHQAGDECLRRVAAALKSSCRRPADLAARYGGEEFALILPDTNLAGATLIAEIVREAIAQLSIPHAHSPAATYVTVSGGVAELLNTTDRVTEQLIALADQALFQSKRLGRNRMVSMLTEPEQVLGEPEGKTETTSHIGTIVVAVSDRRTQRRRTGIDRRSDEEKRETGERRLKADRRAGGDRRADRAKSVADLDPTT